MKVLLYLCVPLVWLCLIHVYRYDYYVAASFCMIIYFVMHYIITHHHRPSVKKNLSISLTKAHSSVIKGLQDSSVGSDTKSESRKCKNETTQYKESNLSRTKPNDALACTTEGRDDNNQEDSERSFYPDHDETSLTVRNKATKDLICDNLDLLETRLSIFLDYYDKEEWALMKDRVDIVKKQLLQLLEMVEILQNEDNIECVNLNNEYDLNDLLDRLDDMNFQLLQLLEEADMYKGYHPNKYSLVLSRSRHRSTTRSNENIKDKAMSGNSSYISISTTDAIDGRKRLCRSYGFRKFDCTELAHRSKLNTSRLTESLSHVYPSAFHRRLQEEVIGVEFTDCYGDKGTYTGWISIASGKPHGYGRMDYAHCGRWYEGDWKHGRWTGHGKVSTDSGDLYEGGLKNDLKHGHGIMRLADGRIFDGEYRKGQMVCGKMTYEDGTIYDGSWKNGLRHGFGRCIFVDGSLYVGEFREGEFHGNGKMTWRDGFWYEGQWNNGQMHGRGREIRADGTIRHDGAWVLGQPSRCYSPNGISTINLDKQTTTTT